MIDRGRNADAAKVRDEFGSLFDGLNTVVLGPGRSCAATCANNRCARFAQGSSDAAPGTSSCPRNHGHATTQCVTIGRPGHTSSLLIPLPISCAWLLDEFRNLSFFTNSQ
jgi:hypothetical protein